MPILRLTINERRAVVRLSARGENLEFDAAHSRLIWRSQNGVTKPIHHDKIDDGLQRTLAHFAGHAREVPLIVVYDPTTPSPQHTSKVAVFPADHWPTIEVA